ncbi:hypothetical protein DFH94DRAFT_430355 [Russula ochroleuca]|uniref:Uncharacterized protein n=1 Tax=Russula ochroleuca TaxID=152965 RepID=A0A9P5MX30_9AGAM|nr:hypothetical protein DFH94DRAFT_430355 [Russula ochroleuca]
MSTHTHPLSITLVDNGEARGVRFDDECVLIPGPQPRSRMPKLLARPSSFIFKRRHSSQDPHSPSPASPRDYDAPQTPISPRSALSRKHSLNAGSPPPPSIQRRSSLPPPSRSPHLRRANTTTATSSSLPSTPLVTIPLRPCCPNCFSATESAALQGDNWIESFSRPVRRRRSVSTDNRPCPPHLVATTSGAAIQWSTAGEGPSTPTSSSSSSVFRSVVVDEADEKAGHTDEVVVSGSDGQGINKVRKDFDRLSVRDPGDDVLPPLLSRHKHKPWLSPIPSNNPSVDDLSPARAVSEEVDSSPESDSVSPASSPTPPTPSSSVAPTPASSPTISYAAPPPTRGRGSSSPSMPGSFRIPKGAALLRAGSDILRGVSVLGSSPV